MNFSNGVGWLAPPARLRVSVKSHVLDASVIRIGFDWNQLGSVLRLEDEPTFVGEEKADAVAFPRAAAP
jgi:hypothetical protein